MSNIDFEALRQSILSEHNRVRADPSSYIPILKEHMKYFKDDILHKPREIPIQTNEGPKAYQEAIDFLKKQRPVDTLTFDDRLAQAAEEHVKDIGPKGSLSHDSSDGKTVSDRIEMFCEWDSSCGENLEVGSKVGQDVIVSLLVNDGLSGRGHRVNLFKPDFKYVGIACGPHKDYDVVTVLDYAGGIREQGKPYYDYANFKYQYPESLSTPFKKRDGNDEKKKIKPKTAFQLQDDDAPDGTVAVKMLKKTKLYNGKRITVTKKFYTLEDGTQHIVEVEEF